MIKQVHEYEFIDSLTKDEYANFSYNGASALYDYLTDLEYDMDQEIEFDRVAIRCDYSEYKTLDKILNQYDNINNLDELRDNTTVIEFDEGYIIQNF